MPGFTSRYGIERLVWLEQHATMDSAITREKQIKKWRREWKVRMIEERNPYRNDMWPDIVG